MVRRVLPTESVPVGLIGGWAVLQVTHTVASLGTRAPSSTINRSGGGGGINNLAINTNLSIYIYTVYKD